MQYSRTTSFIICFFVYAIAFTVAYAFVFFYNGSLSKLWLALIADVMATLVVYSFSVIFKNASLYDPYWSVVPPLLIWYWWKPGEKNLVQEIAWWVILLWAIRLTLNWARGWQGLKHEDWRYVMLRQKNPKLYWLTNLAGIHLFPTLMVFAGMVPAYIICNSSTDFIAAKGPDTYQNEPLILLGFAICIIATLLELVADEQMRRFKKTAKPGEFIDSGVWKYSRHPNYFGEILFWFGLWVLQMSIELDYWYTSIGFVAMLCMFLLASIPMMEKKNLRSKPGYREYLKTVSVLLPWFREE
jgi:steroid 5-alpha reductase family enzyme